MSDDIKRLMEESRVSKRERSTNEAVSGLGSRKEMYAGLHVARIIDI